jgi:uncharacterized protein with HEPN domain
LSRAVAARLQDILEAIERIRAYEAMVREGAPVLLTRDAVIFRLVVIGEAVKDIPDDDRRAEPEIDWDAIGGMRDVLTHEYHRIDQGIVDEVLANRLTDLGSACRRLLAVHAES